MELSQQERTSGQLSQETLNLAVAAVRNNGYMLFERLLPEVLVAQMRESLARLLESHTHETDPNRGANRYQMHLPFESPFSDERVVANPLVLPIVEALVGEDCICHYLASDTALPGSEYQAVHPDIYQLFPEQPAFLPPYSIVVNVPLVDAHEDNGPLEVWPGGTHHYVADAAQVPMLAASMQSQRVLMPAGSVLVRDSRMWHRGTPNRSNEARPNFTLIYSRFWLKLRYRPIPISRTAYNALSPRAQRLFRLENIADDLDKSKDMDPNRFYARAG
ncbi:MAG: phytanoyl-CoA dioxygenase family protein [Chloroflexi bacterium]|nr:phytanoyl-CoA dioxygenase family protein [Chloroflexota bacterium]